VSDTPRTDEQINGKPCTRFEILAGDSLRNAAVPSEFARQLEREVTTANERIQRLEEYLADAKNQYAVLVADVVLYEDSGERIKRLEKENDAMRADLLLWNEKEVKL
jgi:predicted  nucleic acid-binding Zn-ribbon protein